jgi:acid stress-induced BolA-like protein IbaG/YrbA
MTGEEIVARVRSLHPDATIVATGVDCSFEISVVSDAFVGCNTLQRQKPILALFKEDIRSGALHALTIKARTASEQSAEDSLVQLA